ncbi:hypothetical protein K1T71_013154 [Dendrolimus kikuchii]|uniref:Uncharacterized protein n=1 Tax=Dendrolimus kikuchii TaxID=765133 RepID=A0ACC1CJ53_9NEOP|nr:hypothetical protein K1T71_013154 [Dendrolimus kikuchii]
MCNDSTDNSTSEFNKCEYQVDIADEESGEYSTLVNYPFSVSIQRKGAHYATGALVNKRWILSVAREFYYVRESIKLFRARLGSVDCKRGGTVLPFKSVTVHPSYIYGKPNFDLALLRLGEPVNFTSFIKPIKLSKIRADIINAKFMTTYWPRIIVDGKVLPESATERIKYNSMRVSTQRMIPLSECKKTMKRLNESLENSSLCLTPVKTHHSVCLPDAGAPVIAEDGLWGITSGWISNECPTKPGPTIFTRLSSRLVHSWLEANLFNLGGTLVDSL